MSRERSPHLKLVASGETAEAFRGAWEELHGAGSVVAYESFTTGDQDFSAQLTNIGAAGCDIFFTPQYYSEVPLIVEQARNLGLTMPIVGSDSWGDPQLLELCGGDCDGLFFSTHYVASGATGATKEFIDKFVEIHGEIPSDVGALTWDSLTPPGTVAAFDRLSPTSAGGVLGCAPVK